MLRQLLRITSGVGQCLTSTSAARAPAHIQPRSFHLIAVLHKEQSLSAEITSKDAPPEESEELDKLYKTIEIEMRAYEPAVLKSYSWFATTAAKELGIQVGESWAQRKPHHERYTLLKSIHIYKKHMVQYEVRTYHRFARFHCLTSSTADTFLEYIQRNLPEGVGMKVTKVAIEKLPDHIKAPNTAQIEQQ